MQAQWVSTKAMIHIKQPILQCLHMLLLTKEIKLLYVDGHFCYVYKIGIVTNGLGIVRHLNFYNQNFLDAHPELTPNKKTDSPDEDKSIHDLRKPNNCRTGR